MKPKLIVIVGPTASGKTALSLQLAHECKGAVVSADSRQVYAGMNVGTAKPTAAFQENPHDILTTNVVEGVPHYLLNITAPEKIYHLSAWQQAAYQAIDAAIASGHTPLLVGGTMLYADSVIFDYHIPEVVPNEELRQRLEAQDVTVLYAELIAKDPDSQQFIEPLNKRRIIRALEVMAATNQPFSALRQQQEPRYDLKILGLFPGWEQLQENIARRALAMWEEGLVEETQKLQEQPIHPSLLRTLNYAQAADFLAGTLTEATAQEEIVRANMRYAHRQMSWWKGRTDITWFATPDITAIEKAIAT